MTENTNNDAAPPAAPPVPASSPRSAQAPLSMGSWLITAAGVLGALGVALKALIDADLFPRDSDGYRALVVSSSVLGAVLLAVRYLQGRFSVEELNADNSYRLEREEIRSKGKPTEDL